MKRVFTGEANFGIRGTEDVTFKQKARTMKRSTTHLLRTCILLVALGVTGAAHAGVDFIDQDALFIGAERSGETIYRPFESIPEV